MVRSIVEREDEKDLEQHMNQKETIHKLSNIG